VQDNALETFQTAAQQDGTTQVLLAEIAGLSSNTATAVIGQGSTNASTKVPARLAQLNAPATAIKYALQAANGRIAEQMQTMMPKTCNAAILYVTLPPMSMTQPKQQQKMHAQTLWTMIAMSKQIAMTTIATAR